MKFKQIYFYSVLLLSLFCGGEVTAAQDAKMVILDEAGVKNLRIEVEMVEEGVFEESVFALGRIDVFPGHRAVVSSRVAGRASEVPARQGHPIQKGDLAVVVESRQAGEPPPSISLHAPISGIVSAVNIVPGEPVDPDETLVEILDLSEVYALARIPEHLAGRLTTGLTAEIRVAAVPGEVFEAHLEHLTATADHESGTIEAAFHIQNAKQLLRPGMRAEFSIIVDRTEDVFSIPRSALQGDASGRFVYVKDFDLPHAFIKTPVVVGRMNDWSVEVLSGLLPADEVVTQGAYSLAFVGGGTLSLKEALDAAHGHEHAEDGSELTDHASASEGKEHAHEEEHDHAHEASRNNPFWMIVSGVLFILLVLVSLRKKGEQHVE